ncbi:MAG: hypothetical protein K6F09_00110 [Clostridiales bacterium]|nr:hypothetical protein [Clostridiales bacterium]
MKLYYRIFAFFASITLLLSSTGIYEKRENKTVFIAHRGYCSHYLENTEEAFQKAAEVGFGGCETDVRITSDGELILAHGGSYEYADGTKLEVEKNTLAVLTAKPLKNDFTDTVLYPCTFKRYLEILKENDMVAFIELKGEYPDESLDKIINTINGTYDMKMCSIQSMQIENLKKLKAKYPDLPLMFCGGGLSRDAIEAVKIGFDIDMKIYDFWPIFISLAKLRGVKVALWTADTSAEVAFALSCNPDYIESDWLCGITKPEKR